jgi:short subunit dehydrogenase-like uncharacterized protein
MIDQHEDGARKSGARIVHACGFDSIPSDIGVYYLQREAQRRFGEPCSRVKMRVRAMKGSASGGTIASMMNAIEEARADREVARILVNPYSLCPPDARKGPDKRDQSGPVMDKDLDVWTAPFVMAGINTICLALDELPVEGGFWTPASAMGDALLKRLPVSAGLSFTVEEQK